MIMKMTKIWMLAILSLAFIAVSCEKEDDPINEAQLLVEYLESGDGGNYANTAMPAIKTAEHVNTLNTLGTNYIIDVRSADDYADGHIANAVNVPLSDLLTHLEGTTDDDGKEEIHIVCYSGQSAAWGTCLLRLAGYDNVYSMKWGMSSWAEGFGDGFWSDKIGSTYVNDFVSDETPKGDKGDLPVLNTGFETGKEILDARIATVFTEGFGEAATSAGAVYGALASLHLVNYWSMTDYTDIGHIEGALQYTPKESIALDADLKTLPADKEVVVYCWTGQTSANMAAYLRVIGYNAKSLTYGANGMIYDDLPSHKWSDDEIYGGEVVTD